MSLTVGSARKPISLSPVRAALALVGFSAVIGQIVLMRELIVVFNGNEISLGIMLATWLLWTAVGSNLASRLVPVLSSPRWAVALLEWVLGLTLPPTIWVVRASKVFFQTVPGELVGPAPMLVTCLISLSVFCLLSGALFVVTTRMYEQEREVSASVASSSAYLFEAAGSALGGVLASVVLLRLLESFQIAAVVTLLNLCMAAVLLFGNKRNQVLAIGLAGTALAFPLFINVAPSLVRSSQARLWRGFRLLDSRDSIYGNLAVIETGNIRSIYNNGVILANVPDEAAAEEAVHYALLEHPAPRKILLIGGGVNGSIAHVLRHPTVEWVDYVELDRMLIAVARQFFPQQLGLSVADPRVRIHYADGRLYLKTAHDKFDVIVLDLPDPQTAQLNRFYTAEFFRSASEHLTAGGLLALQLRASEDYISPERAGLLRCIHRTLREVFPYVSFIPGGTIHFFGAMQPDVLTENPQVLIARLKVRKLATQYVREYFIPFRMMPDRMAQVHDLLQPLATTPVNLDFKPIAYYFDLQLWSAQFKSSYYTWFQAAAEVPFNRVIGWSFSVLLCVAVLLSYTLGGETRPRASAAFCVAATGFTLMALQIVLLLAFESVYGYVYHQLAILIGMFMAGIAVGSWLGVRHILGGRQHPLMIVAASIQFLVALSAPALLSLVTLLSRVSGTSGTLLVAQVAFPIFAVLCGMLGGYQFPLASEIYLHGRKTHTGLGMLYAVDLLGGCVGALLLAGYLIAVFGFWKTAWFSAAVNLAPALLAVRVSREATMSPA